MCIKCTNNLYNIISMSSVDSRLRLKFNVGLILYIWDCKWAPFYHVHSPIVIDSYTFCLSPSVWVVDVGRRSSWRLMATHGDSWRLTGRRVYTIQTKQTNYIHQLLLEAIYPTRKGEKMATHFVSPICHKVFHLPFLPLCIPFIYEYRRIA